MTLKTGKNKKKEKPAKRIEHDIFGTVPKAPGINSHKKGANNERKVAELLSKWTGYEFQRIPRSGGLRWQNVMNTCGDLLVTTPGAEWPFSVETKHLASVQILENLRDKSKVYTLWDQASGDAARDKKIPMLILRTNGENQHYKGDFIVFLSIAFEEDLQRMMLVPDCRGDGRYKLVGYAVERFLCIDFPAFLEIAKNLQEYDY